MRIGIIVNTPDQVYFYKNICKALEREGDDCFFVARDYGETINLLEQFGIDHYTYSISSPSKVGKLTALPSEVLKSAQYFKKKKIDVITGFGGQDSVASVMLGIPDIAFNDSEPRVNTITFATQYKLSMLFVDCMVTPDFFKQDLGRNHVKVKSLKELAYLHPNYYSPNPDILEILNLSRDDRYAIIRLNAFDAVHDVGFRAFTLEEKRLIIKELEKRFKVFISSEVNLPRDLREYELKAPKHRIHDVEYYSSLCITETGTMTTEAAILGIPTIQLHPKAHLFGNFIELQRYGLIFSFTHSNQAMDKIMEISNENNLKNEWKRKESVC